MVKIIMGLNVQYQDAYTKYLKIVSSLSLVFFAQAINYHEQAGIFGHKKLS